MKRFIVLSLLVATACFTACVDDITPATSSQATIEVEVGADGVSFPKEKNATVELAFRGSHPLIATSIEYIPNGGAKEEKWLTVTVVSSTKLRLVTTLDNTSPTARKATLKVSSGYGETTAYKEIVVSQDVFAATLTIDKDAASLKNLEGASFEVIATTNQQTVVAEVQESAKEWLEAVVDGKKITIKALSKNLQTENRVGVVNIIGGTAPNNVITLPVTVTQDKYGAPIITPAQVKDTLANTASSVSTFELFTEDAATTVISVETAAQSWLMAELNPDKTLVTLTSLSANTVLANRNATVTITAGTGQYISSESFTVTQVGRVIVVGENLNGGIVFWVAEDLMTYKVVHPLMTSLTQVTNPCLSWAVAGTAGATTLIGCTDQNNGAMNVAIMKSKSADLADFPAAKYCNDITTDGGEWYLPARNEMYTQLYGAWSTYDGDGTGAKFSALLTDMGGTAIVAATYGFTSTESATDPVKATCVRFNAFGSDAQAKTGTNNRAARCIKAIER